MRLIYLSLLLLLPSFLLSGCNESGWGFTKTKPSENDLVGRYKPDQRTLTFVTKKGKYLQKDMSINLQKDGTFTLSNIPDWWSNLGINHGKFDSCSGKWSLSADTGGYWTVGIIADDPRNDNMNGHLYIVGESPPYKLNLLIGDPDSGEAMEFVLTEEAR